MTLIPEFKNKKLYEQVFTHRSFLNETNETIGSNERLEFLGDSILSFVVSSAIYNTHPELEEGELTNIRSVLTNTSTLYEVAKELEMGTYLKLSRGEEAGHGRENRTILADSVEALIGGIFIDQGLEAARQFIEKILLEKVDAIIETQGLKDPKSRLQEKVQEQNKISPTYKIIHEEGPDHAKIYTIGVYVNNRLLAEGVGHSKQEAEKAAASNALKASE